MAIAVEMPKPGQSVEECQLLRWVRKAGDAVTAGDVVAEIETDKTTFEVVAPSAGVILVQFFQEGDLVRVYTNLCVIGEPGERIETFRPAPAAQSLSAAAAPEAARPAERLSAAPSPSPTPGLSRGRLSPRARRFSREHRFLPRELEGSGPRGRVIEADLRRAFFERPLSVPPAREDPAWGLRKEVSGSRPVRDEGATASAPVLKGIRERIASRMRESLASTAQYTLNSSAAASGLLALRARVKAARFQPDINLNEMVAFCTVLALRRRPELNAEFVDGRLVQHSHVHLGFACDTARGLLVPVVRNAHELNLASLSMRMKELTVRAVEGKISPEDLAGGTFTISNLGSLGIESFTPIVNPPQVAVLGINAIRVEPVRREGAVVMEDRIGLSLTADHQIIDGAPGARFLGVLRECIESVESLAGLDF